MGGQNSFLTDLTDEEFQNLVNQLAPQQAPDIDLGPTAPLAPQQPLAPDPVAQPPQSFLSDDEFQQLKQRARVQQGNETDFASFSPNLEATGFGLKESVKSILGSDLIESASAGMQKALLVDLPDLLGLVSDEEAQRLRSGLEGDAKSRAGFIAGQFLTPSLGPLAGAAKLPKAIDVIRATPIGAAVPIASKALNKLSNIAVRVAKFPQKALKKVFTTISGLGTGKFNEKVKPIIRNNPELLFEPKVSRQTTFNEGLAGMKKNIKVKGKIVSAAKKQVAELSEFSKKPMADVLDAVNLQAEELPPVSKKRRVINELKNMIRSGGKTDKPPKIKAEGGVKTLAGFARETEKAAVKKSSEVSELNINQLQNIVDSFDEKIGDVWTKVNENTTLNKSEGLLISLRGIVNGVKDDLIKEIDDKAFAQKLISAKGAFSKAKSLETLLGGKRGLTQRQFNTQFLMSFTRGRENDFDAFRTLVPEKIFNRMFSKVINEDIPDAFILLERAAGPISSKRAGARIVFQAIPKSAAVIAGELPEAPIGSFPTALFGAKQGVLGVAGAPLRAGLAASRFPPVQRGLAIQAGQLLEEE